MSKEAFEKIKERLNEQYKSWDDKYYCIEEGYDNDYAEGFSSGLYRAIDIVNQVAEEYAEKEFSEWCHDCPAYDKENHHCPRLCKVIRTVVEEIKEGNNSKWIPCSEGLPEEKGWYQCTCADEELWLKPMVRDLFYYPTIKLFVDNIRYSEHGCNNIKKYDWTKYVIAWQPLPAPYKPKGE